LPEVLIAALLFAVSLFGLLQYHQVLLQGFQRQWQYRQAWTLAHLQLEHFAASGEKESNVPPGWQQEIQLHTIDVSCQRLMITIQTPQRQQAQLSRWFCTHP
jgi:prepilin peptidase dependent protein C